MILTAPITKTDDVLAAMTDGYLLVVEAPGKGVENGQAFLVDGQFAHGSNRPNVPVPLSVVSSDVLTNLSKDDRITFYELTKDEVKSGGCRPLHLHRKPKVYGLKG